MRRITRAYAVLVAVGLVEAGCGALLDLGPERRLADADASSAGDGALLDALETDDGADADTDARAACDRTKGFSPPELVSELDIAPIVAGARLTPDMKMVVFHARLGTAAEGSQLHQATRDDPSLPFGAPALVPGLATYPDGGVAQGQNPTMTADRLSIYFSSQRGGTGTNRLWFATRARADLPFDPPSLVETLDDPTATETGGPMLVASPAGLRLYFQSSLPAVTLGGTDIFHTDILSPGVGDGFVHAPDLSSPTSDDGVAFSADLLTVYVSRRLYGNLTPAPFARIWTATRSRVDQPFERFTTAPSLSSVDANDRVTWVSPDDCTVYLESSRSGTPKVYRARRLP